MTFPDGSQVRDFSSVAGSSNYAQQRHSICQFNKYNRQDRRCHYTCCAGRGDPIPGASQASASTISMMAGMECLRCLNF